ncbi:MAG: 5-methyltetrahydropteroyltriglutamate--homocysteine S-methyltransferase [Halothiobacillus sp. 15-55-196]|jgi:5-methyltetrahydropteroyltriglutamate--homocysteine methyltransferase|uniref:5-methyltetrahydropteroyltriglutamate-- homocysteine S-methyltransferase n=1 Tax=Halothiobacillus sp. 15-55-196 TaxID=1970382 RepID=UPI000BD792D9|nr:5-methyltetrahydropteroyltriglutamate--homocysteine S-methyltransferase [Halothiobacillus sp. 15-55-196]OZB36040.1 MAG: 5-methyltetrahydropteroyltriglutamate--homocysteine S-methyltransferase [Halothiobacillus sp. 15-55-196]
MSTSSNITTHTLGFPRIGERRALKWALESHWRGESSAQALQATAKSVRAQTFHAHKEAGITHPPVGDFSFYDHMADTALLFGQVPHRFGSTANTLENLFTLGRGKNVAGQNIAPLAMKKWFNSNYHYLVPELEADQPIALDTARYLDLVREALAANPAAKPVLVGPLTFLYLSRGLDEAGRLAKAEALAAGYQLLLNDLKALGVAWVQIDEPILTLDLPADWLQAFEPTYHRLKVPGIKLLLTTYFGDLNGNVTLAANLPVDGLHIDATMTRDLIAVADRLPDYKVLSVGILDGRSIWRADLTPMLQRLAPVYARLKERLWLAPSCSLLHLPLDATFETKLPEFLRNNLSYARQKLTELNLLARGLSDGWDSIALELNQAASARAELDRQPGRNSSTVRAKTEAIAATEPNRSEAFAARAAAQQARFNLPLLPTTTIGSFPQTHEIRAARKAFKNRELSEEQYESSMKAEICHVIETQEKIGLDVLVHGEAERNDMVEYFGEQLDGFAFTQEGWVQSYGSRCVKPPIIWGDVQRSRPMTVAWARYAQSLSQRPVKGMLTGPVTILFWSFVRDDLSREAVCYQIAEALRQEINDLADAGIGMIQVDEPAFREGLPLRKKDWSVYLAWAVRSFKHAVADAPKDVQIHTHMCYSEFNDIIEAIAALDADVITIETTRSNMKLLDAFSDFHYPNAIGPGIYDIHAPQIPTVEEIEPRVRLALEKIPAERLWINPDCGLKTRTWAEVIPSLEAMVAVARKLRKELG